LAWDGDFQGNLADGVVCVKVCGARPGVMLSVVERTLGLVT
jgi:hypothetical protein